MSFEAFSEGLKHLLKYCSFANLAEVFSDFSLKNGNIINLGLDLLHVSKSLKGIFLVEGSLFCACMVRLSLNFPPVCPIYVVFIAAQAPNYIQYILT